MENKVVNYDAIQRQIDGGDNVVFDEERRDMNFPEVKEEDRMRSMKNLEKSMAAPAY